MEPLLTFPIERWEWTAGKMVATCMGRVIKCIQKLVGRKFDMLCNQQINGLDPQAECSKMKPVMSDSNPHFLRMFLTLLLQKGRVCNVPMPNAWIEVTCRHLYLAWVGCMPECYGCFRRHSCSNNVYMPLTMEVSYGMLRQDGQLWKDSENESSGIFSALADACVLYTMSVSVFVGLIRFKILIIT